MKKLLLLFALLFSIFITQSSILNAQSWSELVDSSKSYIEKRDFKTALKWAKIALPLAEKEFGINDTNYISTLKTVSLLFFNSGNLDSAVYYSEINLNIARNHFNGDNPELADIISRMANYYDRKGRYSDAEPLYKEALEMNRRIYVGDNPKLNSSIRNLAVFYNGTGKYAEAEPLYKEALEMSRRIYNGDNPSLAIMLNTIAHFYHTKDKFAEAEPFYIEALEMNRRLFKGDNPDLAVSIMNMASFYKSSGKYSDAEPLFNEGLQMFRRLHKGDHFQLSSSITLLAGYFDSRGRYSEAEPLYKEGLEMNRRLYKGDHKDLTNILNSMAIFYSSRGRFAEAELFYKESLEMGRRLYKTDHQGLNRIIFNVAMFYHSIGRYADAEALLKEGLEMSRRLNIGDNPELAIGINKVGFFYHSINKYDDAEPLYKEALEMSRRLYKGDNPELAVSIFNLGSLYKSKGMFAEAEPLYEEGLAIYRRLYKDGHPNLGVSMINMASLYNCMGLYADAELLFSEGLKMHRRLFKGEQHKLTGSITNVANYYFERGKYADAEPLYIEALRTYSNMLNNYFPSLSEKEKKQYWNTVNLTFEQFYTFTLLRSKEKPNIIGNMYDMQLFTKGILFNSTSKMKKRIMNSNDTGLVNKFKEFTDKRDLLVKLYTLTEDERKKRGFNLDSIEKVSNELEKELSLKSELYAQIPDKKNITWNSIQEKLKPNEAAVEAVRFRLKVKDRITDTVYYAFLILTDKTKEHPELLVLENGNELENEYYNYYRSSIKIKNQDKLSYKRYWKKLNEKLKGCNKIYFSADGVYNKLNPETLLMPNGKYILEEKDIQQINSTRDLIIGYNNTKKSVDYYESAVLIGNPNFSLPETLVKESSAKLKLLTTEDNDNELISSTRGINLINLPGTEKEIKTIEKLLKKKNIKVETYLGDMALKTAVKSVFNPGILHIATHGMFLSDIKKEGNNLLGFEEKKMVENPLLRSGLFFTGADNYLRSDSTKLTDDENGILTAFEAMNLDLDKTELVVLSACETGLGEIKNGEGVYGLKRAFQQAGAHTVIMSLWTVSDEVTQELMTEFYSNWVTGITKREAFIKAKLKILEKYSDPYYWGAFVMVGE